MAWDTKILQKSPKSRQIGATTKMNSHIWRPFGRLFVYFLHFWAKKTFWNMFVFFFVFWGFGDRFLMISGVFFIIFSMFLKRFRVMRGKWKTIDFVLFTVFWACWPFAKTTNKIKNDTIFEYKFQEGRGINFFIDFEVDLGSFWRSFPGNVLSSCDVTVLSSF